MAKLKVEVVTPEKRVLSAEADEVIAPGAEGLFGVRPGHTPLLSLISAGALVIRNDGRPESFFVSGGFVEVGPTEVRILAERLEPLGSIELEAAQERISASQAKAQGGGRDDVQFGLESAAVKKETARMAAAG